MLDSLDITIKNDINKKVLENKELYHSMIISLPIYKEDITSPFINKHLNNDFLDKIKFLFSQIPVLLENKNLLFIYGSPLQLMKCYELLPSDYMFRYWIALDMIDSLETDVENHLKHNHLGILMLIKEGEHLPLDTKNTRAKYLACSACKKNIKDWGGKKHLMNVNGACLSDVWRDLFELTTASKSNQSSNLEELDLFHGYSDNFSSIELNFINYKKLSFDFDDTVIPLPVLQRLLNLIMEDKRNVLLFNCKKTFIKPINKNFTSTKAETIMVNISNIKNKILLGDCITQMENLSKEYPEGVFDLVFADPPYNLSKDYKEYDDGLSDKKYIEWCNNWLKLCVKLTKPTGNILILNLPKWGLEHAKLLNEIAYFQNWIVWDALSTPKGKIMPAHYSLLYYTKSAAGFTYNPQDNIDSPEYCLRGSCINRRKKLREDNKISVSDIWWDIHRIKHKKVRDDHPCQLPEKLMNRIINVFSNKGDLVFDPFGGAGTTAISALNNNRFYATIELDEFYFKLIQEKIGEIKLNGAFVRTSHNRKNESIYTKKDLELKVQTMTQEIGRKPSFEEYIKTYDIQIDELQKLYDDPKTVLKAGRIALLNS